jgi:hypothetical protein
MNTPLRMASAAAIAALLAGCGGSKTTVQGHVSDGSGSQSQAMTSGITSLGGSGTATAASTVNAYTFGTDGKLNLVASGSVGAGGSYALDVPEGSTQLVIQAVDAQNQVLASAIVEAAGTSSSPATAEPMTSESSLEAQVLIDVVKQGLSIDQVNTVDLRTRIDSELAAAVSADVAAGGDLAARVNAIAVSIAAAQQAQLDAAAKAQIALTQQALFAAELSAQQKLDAALDSGSAQAQAYATFFTELAAAQASAGLDAKAQNTSERDADASFRLSLQAQVGGSADTATGKAIADAAIRGSAALEARASAAAINAILVSANAAQSVKDAAAVQASTLTAQVAAAASAKADTNAFATFSANVASKSSLSSNVLGQFLGVSSDANVQAALDVSTSASTTLSASLNSVLTGVIGSTSAIDFNAIANQVVSDYAIYDASVQAQATNLAAFGTDAQAAVDLMIVANGAFQVGG